jgi:non-specific serine/threonine protein kinase
MIGKAISHYKITEKLGKGGMGEVYLADDLKLERQVAIKFLPEHLTKDKENVERFEREAKAAAALNHPNIITIHDVIDSENRIYIVMEYVEGDPLRTKIDKGVSDIDQILNITKQICEGLEKAHQAGIVHRDIKPENILIDNDGRVKILDFGLAKLKGVSKLTKESCTLGTIYYISPEQLQGKEVDHRSDIWSLGVVLYELFTGEVPFKAEYESAVIYSILNEEVSSLNNLRLDVPSYIENVITKSLNKDPAIRYQSIEELLHDLKKPSDSLSFSKKRSIIVLPFEDMNPEKDNEYFSDGLTEEIITDLSKINDVFVISRSSSMTLKGTKKKIKEIAKEVNVQFVLEGGVRKSGNNLRITAQLIDAKNDTHLWAEKYSGTLDDVFEIQEKVSHAIVNELKLKLSPNEKKNLGKHQIQDMRAMECWLRAKQEIHHYTKEAFDRAVSMIEDGLNIVGDNVLLFWGLGYINWFYVNMGIHLDAKYLDKAEEYVKKIFKLEPKSFYGYQLQGLIAYKRGDVKKSIHYTIQALEIEPSNPEALDHLIWMYADVGKTEKSAELIKRLLSVDPFTAHNHWARGYTLLMQGRLKDSIKGFHRSYELEPENWAWRFFYALILFMNNENSKANLIVDMMEKETPDHFITKLILFTKYALSGEKENALQMVTDELRLLGEWDEIIAWLLAQCYSLINEKENALYWLENSVNRGIINYLFLTKYNPFLENIRSEVRFKNLMDRVKYEWEHLEV